MSLKKRSSIFSSHRIVQKEENNDKISKEDVKNIIVNNDAEYKKRGGLKILENDYCEKIASLVINASNIVKNSHRKLSYLEVVRYMMGGENELCGIGSGSKAKIIIKRIFKIAEKSESFDKDPIIVELKEIMKKTVLKIK
jgi:hypothetical protein